MKKASIPVHEHEIEKCIRSGIYRNHYLIYSRKSTDEPNNQKNSIKYQKIENTQFAIREKLPIADITIKGFCTDGVISEKHSGFKEGNEITITKGGLVQYRIDRPKFQRLVQYLSRDLFKGVVVLCWDRISRNRGDDTVIRKLMRKGIDIRFVYANYDKTSSGQLHMDIDSMFAEHHSRVTGEKVRKMTESLREKGMCTFRAPIGYLNTGSMRKPFDPERAPIIRKIFEMYATGEWSLADLARWANQQGLKTMPMRKRRTQEEILEDDNDDEIKLEATSRPILPTHIHQWFTNPFYQGKILQKDGSYIPSNSHEALVSDESAEQVRAILHTKKVSIHYEKKLDLPYRGIARCAYCHRIYTPYMQKGILYFGCRCAPGCPNANRNFSIKYFEEEIGKLLSCLSFTEDEIVQIEASMQTDVALLEEKRHKEMEVNERKKRKIREDLAYLRTHKLDLLKSGVYTPESLVEEEIRLDTKLVALQRAEEISDVSMRETMKDLIILSELLEKAYLYYENVNSWEKERLVRIIFSELEFSEKAPEFKCKKGIQALESRFVFVGGYTIWFSEAAKYGNDIRESIQELKKSLIPIKSDNQY